MDQELFNPQSSSVTSSRILYTPSTFARTSLLHLQEIGSLQAIHQHTSTRTNLTSFLCFVVLSGEGTLSYEEAVCRQLSSNNTKWNRSSASGSNASNCEGAGMLGDITAADEIYIVTGRTDMRKSIDGLCAIVEDQLHMDPRRSALYLFCGKRCDRIKALLWESDGFVLLYKRMEVQGRFRWPRNQLEVKQLTWQQFDWLMSGLEIEQPKAFKPTE